MSQLAQVAAEVSKALRQPPRASVRQSRLATLAAEVNDAIRRQLAAVDREAEWQRVHSYIADVLKDTHVLYAKLARLEGDFAGEELTRLERISEAVLQLGNELSGFSKAFYEGKYEMAQQQTYGEGEGGGGGGEGGGGGGEPPIVPLEEGAAEALLGEGQEQGAQQEAQAEGEEQGQQAQQ
jgi:hypothetical protein